MDYSQVCQGWVYTITNKVNGKMYVGKTIDYTQRKWQHFHREECPALKNAFKKYGIDNFEMKPVLNFYAINKEVLNSVLSWLEKFYIKKYGTYSTGYNITKGGEGTLGYKHTEEYKLLMRKKQKEYKAQNWVKEKDRQRMLGNTLSEEFKRPILQYSLDGDFIKEYSWIGEAIDDIISSGGYTSNWRSIHSNLIRALNGNNNKQANNKAYDSMWRYKESDNYLLTIEPYKRKKEKPVYHYSKDGELLESYKTLREAAVGTGMEIKTIKYMSYNGDLRRKEGREPKTDYWSRTAPNEK
jgi:group I intron endonuclease